MTIAPRLVSVYFEQHDGGPFARMAKVLESTARANCPLWDVDVRSVSPAPIAGGTGTSFHVTNTQKLGLWRDAVTAAQDGTRMALIDADTWIERPLDPVWDLVPVFDVALTQREGWPVPFNLGVVFVRVSDRARAFMDAWCEENDAIFRGGDATLGWRQKYGGVNQAAFARLIDRAALPANLRLRWLACREWNCEDSAWGTFDPDVTRIVHLKSGLRDMAIGQTPVPTELRALVARWWAMDRRINNRRERRA